MIAFYISIECHHCHTKYYIVSRCPQCALVIDCVDDNLVENTDELLVIDPLELNYDDGPSLMYEDNFPLLRVIF